MHNAGTHTDSIPRSATWAILNFSFARFASDLRDEAFLGILLRQMTSNNDISRERAPPTPRARNTKDNQALPSLEELGLVVQEGNIFHRTYPKCRILRAHYRRLARDTSEQRRFEQYRKKQQEKDFQAELARVAKKDTKREVVKLTEAWQQRHPGQLVTLHVKGQIRKRTERNIETKMLGEYGRELEQNLRECYVLAPGSLPDFPQKDNWGENVDGGLTDMFSKLRTGSVGTGSSRAAHGHGYGTFQHPCIEEVRIRIEQCLLRMVDIAEVTVVSSPHRSHQRALHPCTLPRSSGSSPSARAVRHIPGRNGVVQSMAHLRVSFILSMVEYLAHKTDTGDISEQYLEIIADVAQAKHPSLLVCYPDRVSPKQPISHHLNVKFRE
jgi:hypothetical protein